MRVAFFGAAPKVGTSANMQLAVWGNFFHPVFRDGESISPIEFTDCKNTDLTDPQLSDCDLLAVNISLNSSGLEELILSKSFVHKNIVFLIGKYDHSQNGELERLSRWYRIPRERICPIPYNQRFKTAYESGCVPGYLKWQKSELSVENMEFMQCLRGMLFAMAKFGKRKGEIYYG
ncbi:MAG: hypothetical protein NC307_06685 [Roseburia sp.]|nr:hypothetical protein [Roseburia sp.]